MDNPKPAHNPVEAAREGRIVIGWKEYVDLPAWGIFGLRAKIDTGAKTSAIHVEDIALIDDDRLVFHIIRSRRHPGRRIEAIAPIKRRGRVRSSNGGFTTRYFVETPLRLGGVERMIEISLVDRQTMTHRMLIGRSALADCYWIDAARCFLTRAR